LKRNLEIVIAYNNANVKIIGSHSGLAVGEDGASHQATEDIALMRVLPNMSVISPADAFEAEQIMKYLIGHKGPVYLRLNRSPIGKVFEGEHNFEFGKGVQIKEGTDATIIATGSMVSIALEAAKEMEKSIRVINISTIKPLDKEIILTAARETKGIVTAEDHSIIGGLGAAVAEVVSESYPVKVLRVGVEDTFAESGPPKELYQKYGLTKENIKNKVMQILKE